MEQSQQSRDKYIVINKNAKSFLVYEHLIVASELIAAC